MTSTLAFNIGEALFNTKSGQPVPFQTFGSLATTIISILTWTAAVISVFFIILGGIKMITAGGDMKKIQAAQGQITYAIIGLAVTALAFVILQVVQYFFGSTVQI